MYISPPRCFVRNWWWGATCWSVIWINKWAHKSSWTSSSDNTTPNVLLLSILRPYIGRMARMGFLHGLGIGNIYLYYKKEAGGEACRNSLYLFPIGCLSGQRIRRGWCPSLSPHIGWRFLLLVLQYGKHPSSDNLFPYSGGVPRHRPPLLEAGFSCGYAISPQRHGFALHRPTNSSIEWFSRRWSADVFLFV